MPTTQNDRLKVTAPKSLARSKDFTDTAMNLEIDEVLQSASRINKIGSTVANLTAESLALAGDTRSKGVITGAYEDIYTLMRPTLDTFGPDAVIELFEQPGTLTTLQSIARVTDDRGMRRTAKDYAIKGKHLHVTDEGLVPVDDFEMPKQYESDRGGCPFAQSEKSAYYSKFTNCIVETYAEAHRRGMPRGWLGYINQTMLRR